MSSPWSNQQRKYKTINVDPNHLSATSQSGGWPFATVGMPVANIKTKVGKGTYSKGTMYSPVTGIASPVGGMAVVNQGMGITSPAFGIASPAMAMSPVRVPSGGHFVYGHAGSNGGFPMGLLMPALKRRGVIPSYGFNLLNTTDPIDILVKKAIDSMSDDDKKDLLRELKRELCNYWGIPTLNSLLCGEAVAKWYNLDGTEANGKKSGQKCDKSINANGQEICRVRLFLAIDHGDGANPNKGYVFAVDSSQQTLVGEIVGEDVDNRVGYQNQMHHAVARLLKKMLKDGKGVDTAFSGAGISFNNGIANEYETGKFELPVVVTVKNNTATNNATTTATNYNGKLSGYSFNVASTFTGASNKALTSLAAAMTGTGSNADNILA